MIDKQYIINEFNTRYRSLIDNLDDYLSDYILETVTGIVDTTFNKLEIEDVKTNLLGTDELNNMTTERNIESIDTYFDVMEISDSQKETRVNLAHDIEDVVLFIFSLIAMMKDKNIDDSYWLSVDRATLIAENESNNVTNHTEYTDALENGFKYKIWHTQEDERVRVTHVPLNGAKKPINEPYIVGDSLMLYPKDQETYDADASEIVNCRCSVSYSNY